MRIVRVIEVIVPLQVCAEAGIVDVRRQRQWGATPPTANQFRGKQFSFCLGASIRPQESIEGADARLVLAKADVSAIATKELRLRHRQQNPGLTRIAKDELAGLDWRSLTWQWFDAAALDRGLINAVFVP